MVISSFVVISSLGVICLVSQWPNDEMTINDPMTTNDEMTINDEMTK